MLPCKPDITCANIPPPSLFPAARDEISLTTSPIAAPFSSTARELCSTSRSPNRKQQCVSYCSLCSNLLLHELQVNNSSTMYFIGLVCLRWPPSWTLLSEWLESSGSAFMEKVMESELSCCWTWSSRAFLYGMSRSSDGLRFLMAEITLKTKEQSYSEEPNWRDRKTKSVVHNP